MNGDNPFTDWQKAKFCDVLRVGADRSTACHYVGASDAQLQAELARDEEFARAVLRSQAEAELKHLGNIHKAAQDEKNWRTSAWWLERRAHQRSSGETSEQALTQVAELVDVLAMIIVTEISDVAVQRRLIERLLVTLDGGEDQGSAIVDGAKLLAAPGVEANRPAAADGEGYQ